MRQRIADILNQSAGVLSGAAATLPAAIEAAVGTIVSAYREEGKVVAFGNGGSATDALHLVAELIGRFQMDRPALAAIALSANPAVITAVANDLDFSQVYRRQVEALVNAGDVAIGISTSGASANVTQGLQAARLNGANTLLLTGAAEKELTGTADLVIAVPATVTARVQEAHIAIIHVICEMVETELFGNL